jgi:hypothetical protein
MVAGPNQRLANEQDEVGIVVIDELGQRAHQRLVVLHAPRRVVAARK